MFSKTRIPVWALAALAAIIAWTVAIPAADAYARADFTPSGWRLTFSEVARSVDIVGFLLLTLTVVLLGMSGDLLNHLRIGKMVPEDLLAEVQAEMANGEYDKALDLCEKSDCLIGQIFAATLAKTDYSFERMEEAMRVETEIQGLVWRQWIRQFKLLALIGPLLGVAGAVVNIFRLVADLTGRPNVGLALASSFEMRALVYNVFSALLIGIGMGVVSLGVYAFASSKLEKILVEARRLGEELLDPFRPLPLQPEE